MRIDSKVRAIDPTGCGCTECLTGVYVPLNAADDDHIQALLLGIVADHTGTRFDIAERVDGQFAVTAAGREFLIQKVAFPITANDYTLDLFIDTVVENLVHLRA